MPYISVESGALSDGQKEELSIYRHINDFREERAALCKWIKDSWRKIGAEEYRRDNESYSFRI